MARSYTSRACTRGIPSWYLGGAWVRATTTAAQLCAWLNRWWPSQSCTTPSHSLELTGDDIGVDAYVDVPANSAATATTPIVRITNGIVPMGRYECVRSRSRLCVGRHSISVLGAQASGNVPDSGTRRVVLDVALMG